jgi:16S rRNA (cytosine1402-N4)-methyltransferase
MHTPVLKEKVLEYLDPQPNQNFVDCTAGAGGHTFAILEKTGPSGKVLAIDWDEHAARRLAESARIKKLQSRTIIQNENFADLIDIVEQHKFRPIHGILLDLGFSSDHVENAERGFSFQKNGPLDMRYSGKNPVTAEKIVNYHSRSQLEHILKEYGEEEFAKQIAKEIVAERSQKPIQKTSQLVEIIERATPKSSHRKKIHPATKTFQALRIAVNDELGNIAAALTGASKILPPGGKLAVLSFHSLEDRIVKNFSKTGTQMIQQTKKPIRASAQEIQSNPRARSAKLRVFTKIL